VAAITVEAITVGAAIMAPHMYTEAPMSVLIVVCTSIGTCACTKIDPPTSTTSWAGDTTATSGSAVAGTVGTAVGMPMVWAPAGFMLTACGSGTLWRARCESARLIRLFGFRFPPRVGNYRIVSAVACQSAPSRTSLAA
jgi:hypothetical protein